MVGGVARSLGAMLLAGAAAAVGGAPDAQVRPRPTAVIHVALDGDDANDGSSTSRGVKGPVRSFARAQALVRAMRASAANRGVDVAIAGGTYVLVQPLRFTAQDSGTPGAPVTYRPEPGATVTLSGGSPIGPWRAGSDGEWVAALGPRPTGGICPTQLFVGGQRRERPRLPASGTFPIAAAVPAPASIPVIDRFGARAGDLPADFRPDPATEIVIVDAWTASRLWLADYDPGSRQIHLSGTFAGHGTSRALVAGLPYYVENAPTARLAPGTWQCNPATALIRYHPMPGERAATLRAVAPRLGHLLVVQGAAGLPVHDIIFRDIGFAHTAWAVPARGWGAMQAEVGLPAALELANCRGIVLSGITVTHTGANAIRIGANCANVEVRGSHLRDLGGGGVAIGSFQRRPMPGSGWTAGDSASDETTDIRILGNDITAAGRIQRAAVGVSSGQANHVRVADNHITDLYYSGISIGWVWGDGPSLSHDNSVTGNVIDRFGQGFLSDFGGIYTLGRQAGTVISGNRISNGRARDYGGWGLYADQGSSGIRFDHNIVTATSQAGVHVHLGGTLSLADNQISDTGEAGLRCSVSPLRNAVHFKNDIVRIAGDVPPTKMCEGATYTFENLQVTHGGRASVLNKAAAATTFSTGAH